jgi:hypothetical protein
VTGRTVRYGSGFLDQAAERFPVDRSLAYGGMTYGEFMNGPVRSARQAFELRWEQQHTEAGGAVRTAFVAPSSALGPVVFYAVLVGPSTVEIASFEIDENYWDVVEGDPDD